MPSTRAVIATASGIWDGISPVRSRELTPCFRFGLSPRERLKATRFSFPARFCRAVEGRLPPVFLFFNVVGSWNLFESHQKRLQRCFRDQNNELGQAAGRDAPVPYLWQPPV
jgi:hypothetical protein